VIDLREEEKNAYDSRRVKSEFVSNEIDESDLQDKNMVNKEFKHGEE
jgi:hypothetical protein